MTAIDGTTSNFAFDRGMFSDPAMRPHLETYYNEQYQSFRDSLVERQKAEDNGDFPKSIQTPDGKELTPLSVSKMIDAIPSFDQWLDIQQNVISAFDFADQAKSILEHQRKNINYLETVETVAHRKHHGYEDNLKEALNSLERYEALYRQ